jgi:hypothetical protein
MATKLGDVAWAFDDNDSEGKLYCFRYGATEVTPRQHPAPIARSFWTEKCFTLPELIKAMSTQSPDRPGYDEVKVFEVESSDPEGALQIAQRIAESRKPSPDALEETRQILTAYGVRGLIPSRAFSAPFLWYNILPGRSVPVRRLAIHLFERHVETNAEPVITPEMVESDARKAGEKIDLVRAVGECFVTRLASGFLVAINIAVDSQTTVLEGRRIADRVAEAIRNLNPNIRHLFVQTLPDEKLF